MQVPSTRSSRRRFLGLAAALPALAAGMAAVKGTVPLIRPASLGRGRRCGACGSQDHHMLGAACPATPEVGLS